jgi:Putative auto-transporter adhesin, head GIN domain
MSVCDAASVPVDRASIEISGSGDARLAGSATRLEARVSASGNLHARGLSAQEASLTLRRSGSAEVTVLEVVDANLSGSGDVNLYGDAMIWNIVQTGSGELRRAQ